MKTLTREEKYNATHLANIYIHGDNWECIDVYQVSQRKFIIARDNKDVYNDITILNKTETKKWFKNVQKMILTKETTFQMFNQIKE